jgi:hypothetical protein
MRICIAHNQAASEKRKCLLGSAKKRSSAIGPARSKAFSFTTLIDQNHRALEYDSGTHACSAARPRGSF